MSMSRRILAVITCLVFVFACCGPSWICYAVFSEFAVGGLVADVMSFVVSVLIVAMGGAGLGDAINQAAADSSMPTFDFVKDKFEQFVEASGGSLSPIGVAKGIASSVLYNSDGTLVFENSAADFIFNFGDWLVDNTDVGNYVETGEFEVPSTFNEIYPNVTVNSMYFSDNYCESYYNRTKFSFRLNTGDSVAFGNLKIIFNDRTLIITICGSFNSFTVDSYDGDNRSVPKSTGINNMDFYVTYYIYSNMYDFEPELSVLTINDNYSHTSFYTAMQAWIYAALNGSYTGASTGLDVWNDDAATDGYVMDPTSLLGDAVSDLAGAVANIGDYVGTLADIIAGVADPALPVAGIGDVAIDPPAVIDPAIDLPVDPAVPADRAEAVTVTGENTVDVPTGTGDYTLPLSDFFPFCIPFDIYAMLHLLDATPQAPKVSWRFYVPNVCDETIEIDLSSFDSVAQVLRTMEVLAFCVGLGFVTKRLLFGS